MKSNREDWRNLVRVIKSHHAILQRHEPLFRELKLDVDVQGLRDSIKTYGQYVYHRIDIILSILKLLIEHFVPFKWRS